MKTKSNITEKKLTKAELEAREKIINNLKKNKSSLVKRYGKDAEAVMYGRATNIVKKMTKTNTQNNLKELIRKSLMQEADIEVTADRYGEEKALGQAAMMLDVLEDKLKKHDWFYMMSDDNRKYKEGTTQQIEIRKIIKQLEDIGYGADAKELFNQYAPDGQGGISLKLKEVVIASEMTTQEASGHAERFAKYMSDKEGKTFTVTAGSVDGPSFDLDLDGEKYEGGSYIISTAGEILNMALPEHPVYANITMLEGKKAFPDLTGDGKVTKADILKGRGVKLKEEYTEEVDTLALTIKDPNEFEKAKQHFESNSDFYPFDINDEFRTFYFQVQDQADADSTEFYLTQELEGETDLQGYYFSIETSPLSEDLDLGHEDNKPHMLKGDLYRIGKYAMELYQMVDGFEGKGEVDFPAWWQSKITTSMNNMVSAKHYLDFETKEPSIDSMLGVSDNEAPMMNEDEIGKADILSRDLYKLKDKIQPAFFDKIRKFINMGSLSDAEYLLNRVKGQMKEKGLAETIAKKLKESNGLKKGDTVEFEGKKYKIGSFDTEANLVYLNTMDNKPSEDSKGSYLKVHATKVKKTK
jgi:hypothetical protein